MKSWSGSAGRAARGVALVCSGGDLAPPPRCRRPDSDRRDVASTIRSPESALVHATTTDRKVLAQASSDLKRSSCSMPVHRFAQACPANVEPAHGPGPWCGRELDCFGAAAGAGHHRESSSGTSLTRSGGAKKPTHGFLMYRITNPDRFNNQLKPALRPGPGPDSTAGARPGLQHTLRRREERDGADVRCKQRVSGDGSPHPTIPSRF